MTIWLIFGHHHRHIAFHFSFCFFFWTFGQVAGQKYKNRINGSAFICIWKKLNIVSGKSWPKDWQNDCRAREWRSSHPIAKIIFVQHRTCNMIDVMKAFGKFFDRTKPIANHKSTVVLFRFCSLLSQFNWFWNEHERRTLNTKKK